MHSSVASYAFIKGHHKAINFGPTLSVNNIVINNYVNLKPVASEWI